MGGEVGEAYMLPIITRKQIAERIDDLLNGRVTRRDFGEEMFSYVAFVGEKWEFEKGHEKLIEAVLDCFTAMHDLDRGPVGYDPEKFYPSKEALVDLRKKLLGNK